MSKTAAVKVWAETVSIPTYPAGKPDPNPMFLEKRVYQGSSGRVYPHPVIDSISSEKIDRDYQAVYLENDYLKIMLLPELGGRVQRAVDKTNGYDFVYHNRVIKPALVGLAGPWISGGIEFNWPQHHRPSTFDALDYTIEENDDGSKTVWIGEMEKMFRTKGMAGFTLHPDKAYLEIRVRLYNRTAEPQTFLWWANPAVAVNDHTQSVFPPDVHAVFDHGKRDVSRFPIASGTYYKVDYSKGVDISRYKNIPVPTSYMAHRSDYDFVGGYDNNVEAGILHVADHHISPGKKQWTWGNGDFGQAWDRNLTDEDGPYIELMTGVYTDNQPDFSWIAPGESKTWNQYFMPYKGIGYVRCASTRCAVRLDVEGGRAGIGVYVTGHEPELTIKLVSKGGFEWTRSESLEPADFRSYTVSVPAEAAEDFELVLTSRDGQELMRYAPPKPAIAKMPEPAKPALLPHELGSAEALYLTGLHLEQYRHATYLPEDYYLEGLKREPGDARLNTAYGKLLFKRGRFADSQPYFEKAIETLTQYNPNPYDGEALYMLGQSLKYQGKMQGAYDAFYKAIWNAAWQDTGYYELALIASTWGDVQTALEHVEKALVKNVHHFKARHLKTMLLAGLGRTAQAQAFALETLALDRLDFASIWALSKCLDAEGDKEKAEETRAALRALMRDEPHSYIELAIDYGWAGRHDEAAALLETLDGYTAGKAQDPLLFYHLGHHLLFCGDTARALATFRRAAGADFAYCFPNRHEDILALESAFALQPEDAKGWYALGNIWYDRRQVDTAVACWERSAALAPGFATAHRNLALAYYNKRGDADAARKALEKAFDADKTDARVFYELDQLYKKCGVSPAERLAKLNIHSALVTARDDLFIEHATLLNLLGREEEALLRIMGRQFHPWEGGEGKVTGQYVHCHVALGKKALAAGRHEVALEHFKSAKVYPHSLGEGKLAGAQENHINYWMGVCHVALGQAEAAERAFTLASQGLDEPASAMYYNDQPPEMIFYQGLAFEKLGLVEKAMARFNRLVDYAEKHLFDEVRIDYFAVSLPDFLVFEEDLNRKNRIHCHFMRGLGLFGQGKRSEARAEWEKALALEPAHLGVYVHLALAAEGSV